MKIKYLIIPVMSILFFNVSCKKEPVVGMDMKEEPISCSEGAVCQ